MRKNDSREVGGKTLNCERPVGGGRVVPVIPACLSLGKHLDVIEIDGASNRGIDEIRELKSHVNLSPFMGHKKYIS